VRRVLLATLVIDIVHLVKNIGCSGLSRR